VTAAVVGGGGGAGSSAGVGDGVVDSVLIMLWL